MRLRSKRFLSLNGCNSGSSDVALFSTLVERTCAFVDDDSVAELVKLFVDAQDTERLNNIVTRAHVHTYEYLD